MKLEATKFRPREVVKHVLQTAAASLRKILTLEGNVADDVPIEVIGDVLRIRQILTNLISNAIKFTHEGKVGVKLYVVPEPPFAKEGSQNGSAGSTANQSTTNVPKEETCTSTSQTSSDQRGFHGKKHEGSCQDRSQSERGTPVTNGTIDVTEEQAELPETTVWIRCDVYDTGIGIPENALPTLFKKYMQVSADHARKYGGTGLGLAICKQLVELMGGRLTVSSQVHCGSTFTFILPYKVSLSCDHSDDADDDLSDMDDHGDTDDDATAGFFQFQPRTLGSLFSSNGSSRTQNLLAHNIGYVNSHKINGFSENCYSFPTSNGQTKEMDLFEDACSVAEALEISPEPESSFSDSPDHDNESAICRDEHHHNVVNAENKVSTRDVSSCSETSREVDVKVKITEPQLPAERQGRSDSGFQSTLNSSREASNSISKPKILLVEDNKINVMVTRSMMKQLGHTIDVVSNGVEAVRAIQYHSYDLVLMDVCMPVMDGLQTTRLIRSFEETGNWDEAAKAGIEKPSPSSDSLQPDCTPPRRIPIIAMTANALSESADECSANGMDSFISKPVTFQKLKECLEQYL
ncbi:hypothetical protein Goari_008272, partial [Gossypium aridum]|nr:hypothetical protein [Gossypium aridum]